MPSQRALAILLGSNLDRAKEDGSSGLDTGFILFKPPPRKKARPAIRAAVRGISGEAQGHKGGQPRVSRVAKLAVKTQPALFYGLCGFE